MNETGKDKEETDDLFKVIDPEILPMDEVPILRRYWLSKEEAKKFLPEGDEE